MRVIVYTAQVGYQDRIFFREGRPLTYDWMGIKVPSRPGQSSRMRAREIKIMGHQFVPEDYDVYVWIDSTEYLKVDIVPYIEKYLVGVDWITLSEDPQYGPTLYENAQAAIDCKRIPKEAVDKHIEKCRQEDIPDDAPSVRTSLLIRRRNAKTEAISELWLKDLKSFSPDGFGDQISLAYIASRHKVKINQIPWTEWWKMADHIYWESTPTELFRDDEA